jgi:SAM-dependent methyltransferase
MRKDIERLGGEGYQHSISRHGVTPMGVAWPNAPDLATRFEVLLSGVDLAAFTEARPLRVLDLGCGPAFLLDWLAENDLLGRVDYTGLDVTEDTMQYARAKWPDHIFKLRDVRDQPFDAGTFDYCIACGVFGSRGDNSPEDMLALVEGTLRAVWPSLQLGIAFTVMSKHVDLERDDLFHWGLDEIMSFCKSALSRHVSLRLDYGAWDTSVIVTRRPMRKPRVVPAAWTAPHK